MLDEVERNACVSGPIGGRVPFVRVLMLCCTVLLIQYARDARDAQLLSCLSPGCGLATIIVKRATVLMHS